MLFNIYSKRERSFFAFGLSQESVDSCLKGLGYHRTDVQSDREIWFNAETKDTATVYVETMIVP